MRICIVDDDRTSRKALAGQLRHAGFESIDEYRDATELFSDLDRVSDEQAVDEVGIVLMDIVMPGTNGLDAVRTIKNHDQLRDIPVVMVTQKDDTAMLEEAFNTGAVDFLRKPVDSARLAARVRSMFELKKEFDRSRAREQELSELFQELEQCRVQLEELSFEDGLTGAANRRYFDRALRMEWRRALRQGTQMAVLMADIDHFKAYNDHLGHVQGDVCLRRVARALSSAIKRPGDMLARYGGEEFAVVLPDTDLIGACTVAEGMRDHLAACALAHPEGVPGIRHVTVSIGVAAMFAHPDADALAVLDLADRALITAKRGGRDQIHALPANAACKDLEGGSAA